jgi:ABC-type lipoprotein release transport system permease subunit
VRGVVAFVGTVNLRARWRTYAGIALLMGLTIGLALFCIAGARRTQSSYGRFLRSVNPSTIGVTSPGLYTDRWNSTVAAFPEVVRSSTYVSFNVYALRHGAPDFTQDFEPTGTFDDRFIAQDRFTPTKGRRYNPARVDEVVVNEYAAERFGYRIGDRIQLGLYSQEQISAPGWFAHQPAPKIRSTVTVVGIGVLPEEVLQDDGDRTTRLYLTPAYSKRAKQYVTYAVQGLILRHGDRDVDAVKQRVTRLVPAGVTEFRVTAVDAFHAQQAVRPLAIALGLFGGIAAAAGLVLVAQALARAVRQERVDRAVLRAIGATPGAIVGSSLVGPVTSVVAGAALAVIFAVAASPLMPIGPLRRVEVARGVDVDGFVMGLGVLVVAVLLAFVGVITWRESRFAVGRRRGRGRAPRLVGAASSAGVTPPVVTGLRFALESPDDAGAAPSRSVIAGAAVAIAALMGAITFGASLTTLVDHPHLYGWNWDATIVAGDGYSNIPPARARAILATDRRVAQWSGAYFAFDTIGGIDVPLLGMAPGSAVLPTIVNGRFLQRSDEIVLGVETARRLHAGVGDRVTLGGKGARTTATVVGTAILPTIGMLHAAHTSLGVGALVAPAAVPGLDRDITGEKASGLGPSAIFVRYRPGTDARAELAHLRRTTQPLADFSGIDVVTAERPAEIVNSSSIGAAPIVLATALVLGAMVSLGLALAGSVRRRRADLSVLRALGFTPRQLGATVSWHATTTVVLGLIVGVPVGVLIGRVLWVEFAHQLNVVARPDLPLVAVLGIALGAILVGNVVAVLPSRAARHVEVMGSGNAE